MSHHCHANNCSASTSPRMLMCARHWALVPKALQQAVYDAYRPGQERDKKPSLAWIRAARAAINAATPPAAPAPWAEQAQQREEKRGDEWQGNGPR